MKQRTVFITGASRGIGQAISKQLKKEGYKVISPTRKDLDLSNSKSVVNYLEKIKKTRIDILVNNAGINFPQWIEEMSDENIATTIQINLISPVLLVRALVAGMKKRKWGRIVNISSAYGVVARGKQVLYVATKHGINGVTKALALELAPDQILVNSVCPGFTATELVLRNPKSKIEQIEADIPLGRLAKPQEIAHLVSFLVSEKNTYITGSTMLIDGGFSIK